MKIIRYIALTVLMLVYFNSSMAQDKFVIAGGGGAKQGSVYSAVLGDLAGACSSDGLTIAEQTTSGGVQNLQLLLSNKVNAAIVPSGLLFRAKEDNAASVVNIKTLVALHPEAIYLVARADIKKEGGYGYGSFKVGTTDVQYNNPEDLKGRQVGAVGGSMVDGQNLSDKMRFGWVMTEFEKTTDLLGALTTGKIDAVVIQAGIPSPAISGLHGNYKLIPIRGNSDTQAIWNATKVQYTNMNQGKAIDTISAPALLVTRKWGSVEMNAKLASLVQCYKDNLGKIQDTTGTSPAWQSVSLEDQGRWPMYELPKAAVAVAPVQAQTEQILGLTKTVKKK